MSQNQTSSGVERFIAYPQEMLFAVIDKQSMAEAAIDELGRNGFQRAEMHVFSGEPGSRQIDPSGKGHGALAQVFRALQQSSRERGDAQTYADESLEGHCVLGVRARTNEAREQALQILRSHGGRFFNFYGTWSSYRIPD